MMGLFADREEERAREALRDAKDAEQKGRPDVKELKKEAAQRSAKARRLRAEGK